MFSKYEQRHLIKIQIARMLDNAIHQYWKLVVAILDHIVP